MQLHSLGTVDLVGPDAKPIASVLAQPKRFGLLAYLAAARPFGFHQRDSVLALFWPKLATAQARGSLRQALHFLRHAVGEDAIVARGEAIALGDAVWCDVRAFESALDAGDPEAALKIYRGDFLDGFFIADVSARFDQWLDRERALLRERAVMAAWQMAEREDASGNEQNAAYWAHRATDVHATNEFSIQKLIGLLGRHGDRRGAMRAYESFARRLHEDYSAEPARETTALIESVRENRG